MRMQGGPVSPHPVWWTQNASRGTPTCTDRCLPPMGPIRMARGCRKISKIGVGSLAAKNSPTDAVTTADISLTVRAYDHAGLGSPPPKHLGYGAASECPPRRCSFPATPLPALTTGFARGQITCPPGRGGALAHSISARHLTVTTARPRAPYALQSDTQIYVEARQCGSQSEVV